MQQILPLVKITMKLCIVSLCLPFQFIFFSSSYFSTFHSQFSNVQRFYLNLTFSRFSNQTSLFFTWIIRFSHSLLFALILFSKLSNKNAYLCLYVCILRSANVHTCAHQRIFVHVKSSSSSSSFKYIHSDRVENPHRFRKMI